MISVIVPIYNVERYINKCIDSIIHQSYKNLEIILNVAKLLMSIQELINEFM